VKHLIKTIVGLVNDLSLFVVFGVGICLHFFAKLYHLTLPFPILFLASSSVFIIYSLDHLLDLRKMKRTASLRYLSELSGSSEKVFQLKKGERLYYINKFRKPILISCIVLLILSTVFTIQVLNTELLKAGIAIGLICIFYFAVNHFIPNAFFAKMKELSVALTVTLCIAGIPAYLSNQINWDISLIFFIICFQNLLLFSWFDYEYDKKYEQTSLLQMTGKANGLFIFELLSLVNLAIMGDCIWRNGLHPEYIVLILMQITLISIRYFHQYLKKNQGYRFAGDLIFVYPVFALLN
jgi:hypothetical protein